MINKYVFKDNNEKYTILDSNDNEVLSIEKSDYILNGELFYSAFFKKFNKGDVIELSIDESPDICEQTKKIYDFVKRIVDDCTTSINSINDNERINN